MPTLTTLQQQLLTLDRQSYTAYKQIRGQYSAPDFTLIIDHVQGDPFAAPSRLRVVVPQAQAGFPPEVYQTPSRAIALRDYLNRCFDRVAAHLWEKRGSGKSGLIAITRPGQQVLDRSAVYVNSQAVEVRFVVGLPAQGRTILGRQAAALLCEDLPLIVHRSLFYASLDAQTLQHHVETVEDADELRSQLQAHGLVAFIPDGAILPRQSGVDDRPLATAIPFQSPPSLRVELQRPNQGSITGMGIPQGITLIVGGGYHGKSTLLRAIALGVYNHIPGDGREQVVTAATAVKIRAEDGRSIAGVDISAFINQLPQGRSTTNFSTDNASGSTSQAANIMESLEMGAQVLLMDEDTSATNFMIRDRRMQALIAKEKEPITPLIDKIRQLYTEQGVSTVLVMGGSGDYFDVADRVIAMTDFVPTDVTEQARAIAQTYQTDRAAEGGDVFGTVRLRVPRQLNAPPEPTGRYRANRPGKDAEEERSPRGPRLKVRDVDELVLGQETVDLTAVEQLVEVGQVRGIGVAIAHLQERQGMGQRTLRNLISEIMTELDSGHFDAITPYPQGDLIRFRAVELAAAINRLRSLTISNPS